MRWVIGPSGEVAPDLRGRAFGRGAWVHARAECLKKLRSALSRSFRAEVKQKQPELLELLAFAYERRVLELLGAARRQGVLALGSSPVQAAIRRGAAGGVIVARDALAAAALPEVQEMVRSGRASAWGTKQQLGGLFGRPEIAVLAILDERLAQRLFGAIAMTPRTPGAANDAAQEVEETCPDDTADGLSEVE